MANTIETTEECRCRVDKFCPCCGNLDFEGSEVKTRINIAAASYIEPVRFKDELLKIARGLEFPLECNVFMADGDVYELASLAHADINEDAFRQKTLIAKWIEVYNALKNIVSVSGLNAEIELLKDKYVWMGILQIKRNNGEYVVDKLVRVTKAWDEFMRSKGASFPYYTYTFIRPGFFSSQPNVNSIEMDGKPAIFPAGCYINCPTPEYLNEAGDNIINAVNSPKLKKTLVHELAHCVMATLRNKNAIYSCPWLEEGFANLACLNNGIKSPGGSLKSADGETYLSWKYLNKLSDNDRQSLFDEYIRPEKQLYYGHFCDRVMEIKRFLGSGV